jgi:uncharacterized membrane protein
METISHTAPRTQSQTHFKQESITVNQKLNLAYIPFSLTIHAAKLRRSKDRSAGSSIQLFPAVYLG